MRGNSVISSFLKTDEKLLFKTSDFALSSVYVSPEKMYSIDSNLVFMICNNVLRMF